MTLTGIIHKPNSDPYIGLVAFVPTSFPAIDGEYVIIGETTTTVTDDSGGFNVSLVPGTYRVQVSGFAPFFITPDGTIDPVNITTVISQGLNVLVLGEATGSSPTASTTVPGIVRLFTNSADPVVPLASEVPTRDEYVTTVSDIKAGGLDANSLPSSTFKTDTNEDRVGFGNLRDEVTASFGTALDPTKFLGNWNPATNSPTIGLASANSGKWYTVSPAGTASGTNADGTYTLGDTVLSNGTTWLRRLAPPATVPDESVTRPKLASAVDARVPRLEANFGSVALFAILDGVRKKTLWIKPDGTIAGKLGIETLVANGLVVSRDTNGGVTQISLGTVDGEIPLGEGKVQTAVNNDIYLSAWTDRNLRLLIGIKRNGDVVGRFQVDEVVDARGDESSLSDRLDRFLDDRGLPALHNYNGWTLRDWRRFAFDIQLGTAGVQPVIAFLGDSWVWNQNNFVTYESRRLTALYGGAGMGFQTFSGTTLDPALAQAADGVIASASKTGTWSQPSAYNGRGPDLGETTSSTVGNIVTATNTEAATSAVLMYLKKAGGGTFRYRVNGGSWTTVDTVNGSDALGTVTIGSLPSPTITIDVEVLTANTFGVTLFGLDWRKTTAGVRLHRCGHSGSRSDHWAAAGSMWDACITQLAPHVAFIVLGTNDQAIGASEDNFKGYIETQVARLRAIRAGMDIVLVAPTENLAGRSTPMTTYRDALYRIAQEQRCGFLDLIRLFGAAATEYNQTSPRNLMDSTVSNVHLTAAGNKLAADAMNRLLAND